MSTRVRHARTSSEFVTEFAAELRRNPGKWHRWPSPLTTSSALSISYRIARRQYAVLPPAEFEGRCRLGVAYVRYTGGA